MSMDFQTENRDLNSSKDEHVFSLGLGVHDTETYFVNHTRCELVLEDVLYVSLFFFKSDE